MQSGAVRTSTAAAPHSSAVLKGGVVYCTDEVVPIGSRRYRETEFNDKHMHRVRESLRTSFHQVDPLSCPEEDPLACLDIA
jgi:hypothetical protein